MRGASVEVWFGDGEIHELARLRREARPRRQTPRWSAVLAFGRWIAQLRTRVAPAS